MKYWFPAAAAACWMAAEGIAVGALITGRAAVAVAASAGAGTIAVALWVSGSKRGRP